MKYDESADSIPGISKLIAVLPKRIACNRCAKFHRRKNDLTRAILNAATSWMREPLFSREEIKVKVRDRLTTLVNRLCDIHRDFWHVEPFFDPGIIELIMEQPEKTGAIISTLNRTAQKMPSHF